MEHSFVSALLLMFLMADPLGNIPIFISSLKSVPEHRRSRVVIRECVIAALILCIFAFGGKAFLDALGLSQAALSMGGGLIVLLMAIRMVFRAFGSTCYCRAFDVGNDFTFSRQ